MDDGGNPYLIPILIGIIIVLAIALAIVLYVCRESLAKDLRKKKNIKLNNVSEDEVIEEEIISMVKEGHEQGVLMDSEAEMIHNIFEYADKEAKELFSS